MLMLCLFTEGEAHDDGAGDEDADRGHVLCADAQVDGHADQEGDGQHGEDQADGGHDQPRQQVGRLALADGVRHHDTAQVSVN